MSTDHARLRDIPDATVNRLPVYLKVPQQQTGAGVRTFRPGVPVGQTGISPTELRKDSSVRPAHAGRPILNFAPNLLSVPNDWVCGVGMASELQIFAFRGFRSRSGVRVDEMKELMA